MFQLDMNRYEVRKKLGEGTFAQVFDAIDVRSDRRVALKVDKDLGSASFEKEVQAMRRVSCLPHFVKMYAYGTDVNFGRVIVMERLGKSVSDVYIRMKRGKVGLYAHTVVEWCVQMLRRLRTFHDVGLIHRDIKPSNFLFGRRQSNVSNRLHLIDFGLARQYINSDGTIKKEREKPGFRGCSKYASVFAHREADLGRRDDLWSFWFMVLSLLDITLPWSKYCKSHTMKPKVKEMKEASYENPRALLFVERNLSLKHLSRGSIEKLLTFANLIKRLRFEDRPDYKRLEMILEEIGENERRLQSAPIGDLLSPMTSISSNETNEKRRCESDKQKATTETEGRRAFSFIVPVHAIDDPNLPIPERVHRWQERAYGALRHGRDVWAIYRLLEESESTFEGFVFLDDIEIPKRLELFDVLDLLETCKRMMLMENSGSLPAIRISR